MIKRFLLSALILTFAPVSALAFPQGKSDPAAVVRHIFEMADADGSGGLSAEEYRAAGLHRYGVPFEDSDTNKDGSTSLAEYLSLYERHHSAKIDA